jgi:hypothetical protein
VVADVGVPARVLVDVFVCEGRLLVLDDEGNIVEDEDEIDADADADAEVAS